MSERTKFYFAAGFYVIALAAQMSGWTSAYIAGGLAIVATGFFVAALSDHFDWGLEGLIGFGRMSMRDAITKIYDESLLADHMPMADDSAASKERYHGYQILTLAKEGDARDLGRENSRQKNAPNPKPGLRPSDDYTEIHDQSGNLIYRNPTIARKQVRAAAKAAKNLASQVG